MLSIFDISLPTANIIYTLSNVLLVLGALFVLAGTVGAFLTRAGKPKAGVVTATNVFILVHPENVSTLGDAAATLRNALNLQGIATRAEPTGAGFVNTNTGAVHILVGRKT